MQYAYVTDTPPPNIHQIFSPQIWTDHKTGNFEINGQKNGIPAKPERLSSLSSIGSSKGSFSRRSFMNTLTPGGTTAWVKTTK